MENRLVLFFALPCMLYCCGASTPIAHLPDPAVALTYLVSALLMGARVAGPAIVTLLATHGSGGSASQAAHNAPNGVLANPMLWAILLGASPADS